MNAKDNVSKASQEVFHAVNETSSHMSATLSNLSIQSPLSSPFLKKKMQSEHNSDLNASSPSYCDTATQTEWTGSWGIPPSFIFSYPPASQMASFLGGDVIMGNHLLENENDDDDDDDGCDVEYEVSKSSLIYLYM